jgi:hypothetical protein
MRSVRLLAGGGGPSNGGLMRHATNVAIITAAILTGLVVKAMVAPIVSHTGAAATQSEESSTAKPDTSWLLAP